MKTTAKENRIMILSSINLTKLLFFTSPTGEEQICNKIGALPPHH